MICPRFAGLDLIRSCAILFVIAGHFSLNTGFQKAIFEGPSMFIQGTMKFFFNMGVPLFLLLTGYLNSGKEITPQYYRRHSGYSFLSALFHYHHFIPEIWPGRRIPMDGMGASDTFIFRYPVRLVY